MQEEHIAGDDAVEGPEAAYLQNEAARNFFELMKECDIPLTPGNQCDSTFLIMRLYCEFEWLIIYFNA